MTTVHGWSLSPSTAEVKYLCSYMLYLSLRMCVAILLMMRLRMCVVMLLLQKLGMCSSTSVTEVKDGCV
jgi:hypothetical protein